MSTENIEICLGLPEHCLDEVAELYYEAFRQQVEPLLGSREKCRAILLADIDTEMAIAAIYEGRLIGFAGLQYNNRQFIQLKAATFAKELGLLRGWLVFLLFRLFAHTSQDGELAIDLLIVEEAMRGKGVGTALLQTTCDFAQRHGFNSVGLDVTDINPKAQRLYERLGFVPVSVRSYPYLSHLIGSSSTITMRKEILLPSLDRA